MIVTAFPLFSNPFILFLTQRTAIALLAGFTHPSSSLRSLIFPILLAWNVYMLPHYKDYLPTTLTTLVVCFETFGQILSYAEQILLKQWSFDTFDAAKNKTETCSDEHKCKPKTSGFNSPWATLRFGTWLAFSTRYIGTPHHAPKTPPYSTHNPSYIPTRTSFIARKLLIFMASYLTIDILTQGNHPARNPILYADIKIFLFTRLFSSNTHAPNNIITAKELLVRVITSLAFWTSSYFILQLLYGTPQLLTVALGLSSSEQERPILGSLADTYTLRGFWGEFWHQMLRCRLTTIADWVTYDVLRMSRSGGGRVFGLGKWPPVSYTRLVARYTHLMCVFGLSGLLHHCIDIALGLAWGQSGAMQAFMLMGVGIMGEDAVQWVWFDVLGGGGGVESRRSVKLETDGKKSRKEPTCWTRIIGYVWVATWLSVATPWYIYPSLCRNIGGARDRILPFSVVGYRGSRM